MTDTKKLLKEYQDRFILMILQTIKKQNQEVKIISNELDMRLKDVKMSYLRNKYCQI